MPAGSWDSRQSSRGAVSPRGLQPVPLEPVLERLHHGNGKRPRFIWGRFVLEFGKESCLQFEKSLVHKEKRERRNSVSVFLSVRAGGGDSFSFSHGDGLTCGHAGKTVHLTAGPANFDGIGLIALREPESQDEFAGGKI